MANCGKEILLTREGTEQSQRFIEALAPESVKLNDFSLKEWMRFAFQFASHVNYFNTKNPGIAAGDWQSFFKSEDELDSFIEDNELERFFEDEMGNQNITPHLALYICFIKLLELSKQRFNKLTKRHLDFYYQQILQIKKLPATPDKVHAIFELAKNTETEKISESTELDGGKDNSGTKRIYKTTEEFIANKTNVNQLKSVYNSHRNKKIKAATVANSFDGEGKDFPDGDIKWWPFGYYIKPGNQADDSEFDEQTGEVNNEEYPELRDAKLGFALSSNVLKLAEGDRTVGIDLSFAAEITGINASSFQRNLEVYCTGEKGWLGPFNVKATRFSGIRNISEKGKKQGLQTIFNDTFNASAFTLSFTIPKEEKAVVKYNSKVHGENFTTDAPVCRILIKTQKTTGYALYRKLVQKEITSLTVRTDVTGVENLVLQNDTGTINAKKPFYPFGTQPVKKSNFQFDFPEMFEKKWTEFTFDITWKDTPDNFSSHYFAYRNSFKGNITPSAFATEMKLSSGQDYIVTANSHFTAAAQIKNKEQWTDAEIELLKIRNPQKYESVPGKLIKGEEETDGVSSLLENSLVFFNEKINDTFRTKAKVTFSIARYEEYKTGPFRLTLNETFLHDLFPKIYALAMSKRDNEIAIPNDPYTPLIEKITLDYSASEEARFLTNDYSDNPVKLFHEHPFGQSEQHQYLGDKNVFLVPAYCKGGELYIGLKAAKPGQTISLLIQALEGSENTEVPTFGKNEKVEWSVLCNNRWKLLDSNYIIKNENDNFLATGMMKFTIPSEATSENTVLPDGLTWIKASMYKDFDAVCKVIGIHAQAVEAGFTDNQNELSHLKNGLEANTISKIVKRIPGIKAVSQPYSSFGGVPQESDSAYYRRISERLRHKNRAISLWDYEHLVLQNFPEIYKIKCLNHTKTEIAKDNKRQTTYLAPGNVTLVAIPDIVNKNVFDIYQPRVSTSTLNRIKEFLQNLSSLHVNLFVINPEYEEVQVELKVKFFKGYDENYYKTVLKADITKLLSPWAFDTSASIRFGLSFHKSVLIDYLEELKYVDFVEDVVLKHKPFTKDTFDPVKVAEPSYPEAILVSAKDHTVTTEVNGCSNSLNEPAEKCQT